MRSKPLGTILDAVSMNADGALLSILAGEHEDNHIIWKESGRHRVFFYSDKVINGDAKTHTTREITISRLDLATPNPELIFGQRVYTTFGTIELKAHQLYFGRRIDVDRFYVFLGLGDEIPGVGCPDLHCMFCIVSNWESIAPQADTSRFDQNVSVDISLSHVQADQKVTYDIQNNRVVNAGVKPVLGIEVSVAELFSLSVLATREFAAGLGKREKRSVREVEDGISIGPRQKSVLFKLIGVGAKIGDGELKADVNVQFVFEG
ncbi:hypothetical protein IFR05_013522 [Cadophora sp. M221]|nr:hypothetical protein IFR05_013522 [Cadophora sp. M221]